MNEQKYILKTTTGEFYQLARVYYEVVNKKTVEGAFRKLRCMDFDPQRDRWVWLFEAEAKKLRFQKTHNQLSKSVRPLVNGAFTFRGENQMLLDVRSWERATKAIEFFDKHKFWENTGFEVDVVNGSRDPVAIIEDNLMIILGEMLLAMTGNYRRISLSD